MAVIDNDFLISDWHNQPIDKYSIFNTKQNILMGNQDLEFVLLFLQNP